MGYLLNTDGVKETLVPAVAPAEMAHAQNFQRFDGLGPADNYDAHQSSARASYVPNSSPRPGQSDHTAITYTPAPQTTTVGTLGGQPLPVANWLYRLGRGYTPGRTSTAPQFRLGKSGQGGQNNTGLQQTVALSEITNAPPVPGDISAIIAGIA